jgi:hypothetical protein
VVVTPSMARRLREASRATLEQARAEDARRRGDSS